VSSTEAFQRAAMPALQVELSMALARTNNPGPAVGKECRKTYLDIAVGEGAISLDLKAARSLSEAMVAMWKVHQLQEILPMTSWVPGYSENPVTQQRSSHV
jgi:hypothetical protein